MKSILTIVLLSVISWNFSYAQGSGSILRGLGPIAVVVQDIDPEAVREDFNVSVIKNDVELELRKAGIRVVDRSELTDASGRPYLFVVIHLVKGTLNTYSYHAELRFHQNASLTRSPDVILSVPTWSRSVTGMERANRMMSVRDKVKEMLMVYINDYLAANPK
jgi:hypothetical protein